MPDYIPPKCDRCGAASANNRRVYAQLGVTEHLCDRCHALGDWSFAGIMEGPKSGICMYCGGPSQCGGTEAPSTIERLPTFWMMCFSCFTEHHEVLLAKLGELPQDLSREEQFAAIERINAEVEEHMVRFVAKRKQ